MRILITTFILLLASCLSVWSQSTTIYNNDQKDYQKALSLYHRQLYKPAQDLFRKEQFLNEDKTVQSNCEYYVASTAIRLSEPGADTLMENFIKNNPDSPLGVNAYMDVASFYFGQGNYKKVLQWYDKVHVSEISWQDKDTYNFQKGYALFATGKRSESEPYFKSLRGSKQYSSQANYYLGYIAYDSDDYANATTYFERVEEDEELNKNLSYFQADMNFKQGKFNEAIQEGLKQKEKTRNPQELSEINKIIGESYFNLKQYNEALPHLKEYKGKRGRFSNTDYYYLGYVYYQNKDYQNAIAQFNKIIDGKNSVAQNAYYHLAECYLESGQKQQALNAFRNAYQMNFDEQIKKDAHLNYARLSYDIGNPYESVPEVLQGYAKAYPNDNKQEIQDLLIDSYITSRNYQAAIDLLEKSKESKDTAVYQKVVFYRGLELYNELQYAQALGYLKKATNGPDPTVTVRALYWGGETAYQLKDYLSAKDYFTKFLNNAQAKNTKEYADIRYNLAYTDFNLKDYGRAITNFEDYLKSNPVVETKKDDANLRLGDAYFVEGKYWPAMETYNKVIESQSPDRDYAAFQKAISYGFVDRVSRKIEDLEAFTSKYKSSNLRQNALFELGNTYVEQGNTTKALRAYNQLQTEYKNGAFVPRAMLREGLVYYNSNDNQKALQVFKTIARDYPNTTESNQAVATAKLIYVDMGKVDEYANWAKSLGYVSVSDTELDNATYEAAERQYLQQNEKEAIAGFEKYVTQFPKGLRIANAKFNLAQLYFVSNQKDKALPLYESVVQGATNELTEQALTRLTQILLDKNQDVKAKSYLQQLENTTAITQNKIYAQSNMMRILYNEKNYSGAIAYANKVLGDNTADTRVKNDAHSILARSYIQTGDEVAARKAYKEVQKTAQGSLAAEALYYDAYFQNKDKAYKKSNETVQKLAKDYGGYKEFAAKGLVVMAKNFHALNDDYQATYILESVIKNFGDYPEVVAEAKTELAKVKAEAAKSNSSVEL